MHSRPNYVKRNFYAAVRCAVTDGASIKGIAFAVKKSGDSVRRWLLQKSAPKAGEMERVCGILGWDYAAILSPIFEADRIFSQEHLTLETLGQRLLSRDRIKDYSGVKQILCQAATIFLWQLSNRGIPCELHIDSVLVPVLRPADIALAEYAFTICHKSEKGLYARLVWEKKFTVEEMAMTALQGKDIQKIANTPIDYVLTTPGVMGIATWLKNQKRESTKSEVVKNVV